MTPGENTLRLLLAPLQFALSDQAVTEIVVNRPTEAGVERSGKWVWHQLPELTYERLDGIATLSAALSQQDVGPDRPLCSSRLPDGQRIQICRPPVVATGTMSLTIRRPSGVVPTIDSLAAGGLLSRTQPNGRVVDARDFELARLYRAKEWQRFFKLAVEARRTILISGDTGSGKTTFAKALIDAIPRHERLVTIEDTAEFVGLPHQNLVNLFYSKGNQGLARVESEQLIEAALRMRPDRILLQELRDGSAFTFMRSLAAGHPGAITTCHAGSAAGAFDALRLMVKQHEAGKRLADADVNALLHQLVDIVVHCRRELHCYAVEEVYFRPLAVKAAA